jgi:hypothetical protein
MAWIVADSEKYLTQAESSHFEEFKLLLDPKIKIIPSEQLQTVIDFSIREIAFRYSLIWANQLINIILEL